MTQGPDPQRLPIALPLQNMQLIDLLEITQRHIITLIGLPIVGMLLAVFVSLKLTPIYTATALLQVDPKPFRAVRDIQDPYEPGYGTNAYYNTQFHLLKSRKLAERLVTRLQLAEIEEFSQPGVGLLDQIRGLSNWLPFLPEPVQKEITPEQARKIAIARTRAAISIIFIRDSNLFEISFSSKDRELAAQGANALADLYIEELLEARLQVTRKAADWLTKNLEKISSSLNVAEESLHAFREAENIIDVGGSRSILQEEVLDLSRRMREAQKVRQSLQSIYAEISKAGNSPEALGEVSALLIDPIVKSAADSYFTAQDEVRKLEKRYGARHPQMATAQSRLERAKRFYSEQLRLKAQGTQSEYEIALRNERALQRQLDDARRRSQQIESKQYELGVLQREVTSNKQLYDLFLGRFKETSSASNYDDVNARIADPAVPPGFASKPRKKLILAVGLMLGGLFALIIVALREALRSAVETAHDIEHMTSIPVMAVLPHLPGKATRIPTPHWLQSDPKAPFADAIRGIRASLILSDVDKVLKRIAVTSPLPNEGKSTICACLATTMAHNEKVLILDGDLRRPSVHKMFGLSRSIAGVTELINGEISLEDAITLDEKTGVYVLPAGKSPANPAQLLTSAAFAKLIHELEEQFDRIFIDTPPCGASSDALQIRPVVDSYILVARTERTPRKALEASLKQLTMIKANVLGIALNDSSVKRGFGAYKYGYAGYHDRY